MMLQALNTTTGIALLPAMNISSVLGNSEIGAIEFLAKSIFSALPNLGKPDEGEVTRSGFFNCLSNTCTTLSQSDIESRENQAIEAMMPKGFLQSIKTMFGVSTFQEAQELLRLNKNDPRHKLLYFSLEHDWNGALDPKKASSLLQTLAEKFDIKFKLIRTVDEICQEIEDAAHAGTLMNVVVDGHGLPDQLILKLKMKNYVVMREDGSILTIQIPKIEESINKKKLQSFPSCFAGLHPAGKIILSSCCTGAPGTLDENCFPEPPHFSTDPNYVPFAQQLATLTKREVAGAEKSVSPFLTNIASLDPLMFFHQSQMDAKKNLFKIFKPDYSKCSKNLDVATLHPRELQAVEAIKSNFVAQSLLLSDAPFQQTKEYLQLCKEDPRQKMLYVSAKDDLNGSLNPLVNMRFLGTASDKFDLQYKVASSFDEICEAVHVGAENRKVDVLVIDAHGKPEYGLLLEKGTSKGRIVEDLDFAKCFADMQPDGRIILLGGSSGAPRDNDPRNNLAQAVADGAKRIVIAPTGAACACRTSIASINPIRVHHPIADSNTENLFHGFTPRFKECTTPGQLHPREQKAQEIIQAKIAANGATHQNPQDPLRVCKDDPRDKVLFLSAEADRPGAFDPQIGSQFLGSLADKLDMQYKVIRSHKDICHVIEEASENGKIAGLFIQAHGGSKYLTLVEKNEKEGLEWFLDAKDYEGHADQDWKSCFSKLPESSPIFLISQEPGTPANGDPTETLAHKLATKTNRVVHAATVPASADTLQLSSTEPLEVFQPTAENPQKNVFKRFDPPVAVKQPVLEEVKLPDAQAEARPAETQENAKPEDVEKETPTIWNYFAELFK